MGKLMLDTLKRRKKQSYLDETKRLKSSVEDL